MSYSFRIPEEEPICECRWDEARQRMDREDCVFHANLPEEPAEVEEIEPSLAELPEDGSGGGPTSNYERKGNEDEIRPERKPTHAFDRPAKAS